MSSAPTILVVPTSLPVKSVSELIALAKSKPGELNYASTTIGAPIHLAAELFKAVAQVNIVRVPYKGTAQALTDLIGGRIQVMFPPAGSVMQQVTAGKLKALAVTSRQPSPLAPGIPTMAAQGLPGFEAANVNGMVAPIKTPDAVIDR